MTDWIEHKPGPCPIPDAKPGEYEVMWDDGEVITLDVPGTALATVWKEGFVTHYRLIKPAVDCQQPPMCAAMKAEVDFLKQVLEDNK